jgi:hypothetical protein
MRDWANSTGSSLWDVRKVSACPGDRKGARFSLAPADPVHRLDNSLHFLGSSGTVCLLTSKHYGQRPFSGRGAPGPHRAGSQALHHRLPRLCMRPDYFRTEASLSDEKKRVEEQSRLVALRRVRPDGPVGTLIPRYPVPFHSCPPQQQPNRRGVPVPGKKAGSQRRRKCRLAFTLKSAVWAAWPAGRNPDGPSVEGCAPGGTPERPPLPLATGGH